MVMVTLLSSGLILAPLLINEILRTRMNESVQQAILLAQISNMHDFDGRRPRAATQALPLIGFEIATAEAPEPNAKLVGDGSVAAQGGSRGQSC